MAGHLVRECPQAKGGVYEEQCDEDQHADSAAVSEVTHDGHWITVLEREAPQADLSKERGFDVCAVTLRTACGQALTSYARCDIHLQVPPNANLAKVTFEVVDVRHPILSVAGLVTTGHRETFRGQEVELSTAGGAVAPLTRIRGLWYLLGVGGSITTESSCQSTAVRLVTCVRGTLATA